MEKMALFSSNKIISINMSFGTCEMTLAINVKYHIFKSLFDTLPMHPKQFSILIASQMELIPK